MINPGTIVKYENAEPFERKTIKVTYRGVWDGEKAILRNGKNVIIVRNEEWLEECKYPDNI
jgi:hypothetical protein